MATLTSSIECAYRGFCDHDSGSVDNHSTEEGPGHDLSRRGFDLNDCCHAKGS